MKILVLITIFLTLLLINLGGYVHNTGSSLACPDWPLCYGQVMPEMKGGVLVEHSHRLLATLVGILTLVLTFTSRRVSREVLTTHLALGMVIVQGILGGITVIYRLPVLVSTAHLGLSMIFLCTLIYLDHQLDRTHKGQRRSPLTFYLLTGTVVIFLQIVLGASIRHLGLGGICGVGYANTLLCSNNFFPTSGMELIHMFHRHLAILTGIAVLIPNFFIWKRAGRKFTFLPALSIIIVFLQIILGIMTIGSAFKPIITMLHLGGAALLLSLMWKVFLNEAFPHLSKD